MHVLLVNCNDVKTEMGTFFTAKRNIMVNNVRNAGTHVLLLCPTGGPGVLQTEFCIGLKSDRK